MATALNTALEFVNERHANIGGTSSKILYVSKSLSHQTKVLSVCLQNIYQEQRQDVELNNDSILTNLREHVVLSCYHLIVEMANALQHNTAVQLQMFSEEDVHRKANKQYAQLPAELPVSGLPCWQHMPKHSKA